MGITGCGCLLGASLKTLARVRVLTDGLPEAPWLPEGWTGSEVPNCWWKSIVWWVLPSTPDWDVVLGWGKRGALDTAFKGAYLSFGSQLYMILKKSAS